MVDLAGVPVMTCNIPAGESRSTGVPLDDDLLGRFYADRRRPPGEMEYHMVEYDVETRSARR